MAKQFDGVPRLVRAGILLACGLALPSATARAETGVPPLPDAPPASIESDAESEEGFVPEPPRGLDAGSDETTWGPPEPDPEQLDWLQLSVGEWVGGNIELIEDEVVYFDSDDLDDLEIDWDDIRTIHSPAVNSYRMADDSVVTGTLAMRNGVIRIGTDEGVREFPSAMMLSMIEGDLREINFWSFELSLGSTFRSGNSDQTDITLRSELKRETPFTRGTLAFRNAFSSSEGSEVTNNRQLDANMDFYLTQQLFLRIPTVQLYQDRIQNIDLRATVGSGLGYDIVDRSNVLWSALIGGAYQRTEFSEVLPGEDDSSDDGGVLFSTTLELDPFSDIEWDTTYSLILLVTDLDRTSQQVESVLSFEIWGPLDLDVTFLLDRIRNPQRDADGDRPESNDVQLTVGLEFEI